MSLTAFEKYLISVTPDEAIKHVIDCLAEGPSDSQAWDILERYVGKDWRCAPEDLPTLVGDAISGLRLSAIKAGAM